MTGIVPGGTPNALGTPNAPDTSGTPGTDPIGVDAAPGTVGLATIRQPEPSATTSRGAGAPPGGADVPPAHPTDAGPESSAAVSPARASSGPIRSADASTRTDEGSAEPPSAIALPGANGSSRASELPGVIRLPDGGWFRPRGLRHPPPPGPLPDRGLYLGSARLRRGHDGQLTWPHEWIDWPDFLLPRHPATAAARIRALHAHTRTSDRTELACGGGVGRTGTALACLAVLAGLSPADAVSLDHARTITRVLSRPPGSAAGSSGSPTSDGSRSHAPTPARHDPSRDDHGPHGHPGPNPD
nr:protein-tyrosine phosphatase family protein [Candidatus Frankia alpina]